jgi:hypothetical protein
MNLVLNAHKEVCTINKSGLAIPIEKMLLCINIAATKAELLTALIRDAAVFLINLETIRVIF